jgi:hypothetical protein
VKRNNRSGSYIFKWCLVQYYSLRWKVGIGELRVQPNITSITSIVENNSIRIVLVFIFVRFSNQLVNDKARYNINRFVLQCVGILPWMVSDYEELMNGNHRR